MRTCAFSRGTCSQRPWLRTTMLATVLLGAWTQGGCSGRSDTQKAARSAGTEKIASQTGPELSRDASQGQTEEPAAASSADANRAPGTDTAETPQNPRGLKPSVAEAHPAAGANEAAAVAAASAGSAPVAIDGKALYAQHCAACHGDPGDGKGFAAPWLFPKPRDFRTGKFRLVSTTNATPTREDLHAVLLRGMPGSSMPPWAHLPQAERELLVDEVLQLYREGIRGLYVTSLKEQEGLEDEELDDPDLQAEIDEFVTRRVTPGAVSDVPEIGEADAEAIARGKDLYVNQGCASCHGATGKGDGQQKMVDDEGYPTRPRDLTRGIYKGGHDAASIYRRIAYGMPGTPMPSSSKMTPEQMVDVVHYLRSLSDEAARQAAVLNRQRLTAKAVPNTPEAADDELWSQSEPVRLRMAPLWWRDDVEPDLRVQALHDGRNIALRIQWRDATEDRHDARTEAFEDALAAELYVGPAEPFIGMGGPQSPVDIWFWSADREGRRVTVEDVYPDTVVDIYPFHETAPATAEFSRPETKDDGQPDVSMPARASGNPISLASSGSAGSSLTAGGPSTVTFRFPRSQFVTARGAWSDGMWTVVMRRALAVEEDGDGVKLNPGQTASIALAIWDGDQRDRDGKKLVTVWQDLELEELDR